MNHFWQFWMVGWLVLGGGGLERARADEKALELPPLEVSVDDGTKRPWSFWKTPDMEVLSRCTFATTWAFIESHARLVSQMEYVLPPELQFRLTLPTTILLAEPEKAGAQTQDLIAGFDGKSGAEEKGERRTVRTLPNLRLTDVDEVMIFALLNEQRYNGDTMFLTLDNIRHRLVHRVPALPLWYVGGMLALFPDLKFSPEEIKIEAASWCPDDVVIAVRKDGPSKSDLWPLAQLFEGGAPALTEVASLGLWRAEATLLIRWALDGDIEERRAGFFRLVARAAREPLSEPVVKEELGLGYEELGLALRAYLPRALNDAVTLKAPRPVKPIKLAGRLASAAEIVRIKGEWERLTIGYVKARQPEFAGQYIDQARRTLSRAYDAGERDPDFLAVAGLFACDVGEMETAKAYLANAVFQKAVRPRAYWELARLYANDAAAHPYEADGSLAISQIQDIVAPLNVAQAWAPPLVEAYVLSAQTWYQGRAPVPAEEFRRLERGLEYFPNDGRLLYFLTALHQNNGHREIAARLAERGYLASKSEKAREVFSKLRQLVHADHPIPILMRPAPPPAVSSVIPTVIE